MTSVFDRLTFTPEEVEAAIEAGKKKRAKSDPRICACGHNARSHTSESINNSNHKWNRDNGMFECTPGQQKCPCQKFTEVMTATDPRKFVFKTDGPGASHALSKGVQASSKIPGVRVQWSETTTCDGICKRSVSEVHVTPVALRDDLFESDEPTSRNVLLCDDCRMATYNTAVKNLTERNQERQATHE